MSFSHPHHNMIRIAGGTFLMGSKEDDGEADIYEKPQHEVTLPDFAMGQYLVTQHLWQQVMGFNPSGFESLRRPVDSVSWYDAVAFCNRLSRKAGLACVYFWDKACRLPFSLEGQVPNNGVVFMVKSNLGFRLPTEAEWEYAARSGRLSADDLIYNGSDNLNFVGWYKENSGEESHEVGLFVPNGSGLFDMSGNLFEWCWDWHDIYTQYSQIDPSGPEMGNYRKLRGGYFYCHGHRCRAAFRFYNVPASRLRTYGFRLVCSLSV